MSPAFTAIKDDFDFLDEWEDKYRFVIDLGKDYAALPDADCTAERKILGCASQVWLKLDVQDDMVRFQGNSDALIVRGLVAILASLYDGQSLPAARDIDATAAFAQLGLDQHLSAQRSNGLRAMIARVTQVLHDA